MTATPVVIVDDADPAIEYSITTDLWNHVRTSANAYDATYSAGYENATARLNFSGTFVEVYIVLMLPSDPQAVFVIDGAATVPISAGFSTKASGPLYNYRMFVSDGLSAGPHTLEIIVYRADKQGNWPFVLDYIQYVPLDNTATTSGSNTASLSPSPTVTLEASVAEKHRGPPLGPVVGGLLGGLVFIVLLAFAMYAWLRRRRRRIIAIPHGALTVNSSEQALEPKTFPVIPPAPPVVASPPPLQLTATRIALSVPPGMPLSPTLGAPTSPAIESPTSPPTERSAKPGSRRQLGDAAARLFRSARRPSVRVYHSDSGLRFGPPAARGRAEEDPSPENARLDDEFSEIPPQYTEH
ncbi:hypothetical protein GY45DRAFT_1371518 [Cubamyces sp. BRFM 1775]|nr:hypothetical protein GY45DRAFT_1371518 [Cubamyces sp. BRFM 1775]